jgi:hypothetical protein
MPVTLTTTLPFACAADNCEHNGVVELVEVDEGHVPRCLYCQAQMKRVRPPSSDVPPELPGVG